MSFDDDPMLETDQLEQLLETPAPSPPVVVVQYRNRGVPSWIVLAIVLLFFAGLGLYHKLVVERNRIRAAQEAAQDRSILKRIEADRAAQPLVVRETGASTTVLPNPAPGAGDASGSSVIVPEAGIAPGVSETKVPSLANLSSPGAEGTSLPNPSQAGRIGSASPTPPGVIGQSGPLPNLRPGLGNGDPGNPPAPIDGVGSTASVGKTDKTFPAPTGDLADRSVEGGIRNDQPVGAPDNVRKDPAAPPSDAFAAALRPPGAEHRAGAADPDANAPGRDGQIGLKPLPPLPTAEESKRQIEEEAARKEAEINAQVANRNADLRSKWIEEQMKFREELEDVIRSKGMQAGPRSPFWTSVTRIRETLSRPRQPTRCGDS